MKRMISFVLVSLALLGLAVPTVVDARNRHDNRSSWVKFRDCTIHGECGRYHYPPIYAPPPSYPPVVVIRPPVVYPPVVTYPTIYPPVYVERQPGQQEREAAQAALQRAEQGRQLVELAMRAGDHAQADQARAMVTEAAGQAGGAAKAARDIAFQEANGPLAHVATANAQAAQAAADRAAQVAKLASQSVTGTPSGRINYPYQ